MYPPQVCILHIVSFIGIGPKVPELGPKKWSKFNKKGHNSAIFGPIELKFGLWKYFHFILIPLFMEHCSKGKGKRVTSATKHLVNFENRVGREASSEAASYTYN